MASVAIIAGAELAPEVVTALSAEATPLLAAADAEVVPLAGDAAAHIGRSLQSVYFDASDGGINVARDVVNQIAPSVRSGLRSVVYLTDEAGNTIQVAVSKGNAFAQNAYAALGGAVGGAVGGGIVSGIIHLFEKRS